MPKALAVRMTIRWINRVQPLGLINRTIRDCFYGRRRTCISLIFSARPSKVGYRFSEPGFRQKRDNFYHVNRSALLGRYYADFANRPG